MITFLPLDLTGRLPTNLRPAESHILTRVPNKTSRICVLNHGAFYVDNLLIRDNTGRRLDKGVDFETAYLYGDLSSLTAKEIMAMIVVKNVAVVSPISVTYQAVGGAFGISTVELKALMESLEEGNFSLKWEDIIGKPTAYVPEDHDHEWWQLWGMESTVTEIDRIAQAWKYGTKAIVRENENYGDAYVDKAKDAMEAYRIRVNAHITDLDNPHETDKVKAGLSNINNWKMATATQVLDRNDAAHYLPIGAIYRILSTGPLQDLQAHLVDPNNPHATVAADADCYTKLQVDTAFNGKYLWTDTAVNSTLYGGRNITQSRNDTIYNLDPRDITLGGFPHTQLGYGGEGAGSGDGNSGNAPWDWALCGNGQWRHWRDILAPINAALVQSVSITAASRQNGLDILNASYRNGNFKSGSRAYINYENPVGANVRPIITTYAFYLNGVWA